MTTPKKRRFIAKTYRRPFTRRKRRHRIEYHWKSKIPRAGSSIGSATSLFANQPEPRPTLGRLIASIPAALFAVTFIYSLASGSSLIWWLVGGAVAALLLARSHSIPDNI